MSRSGYIDDYEHPGTLNLWRANVDRTLAGARGQAFLREMGAALDAMPVKELITKAIVQDSEHVCGIGAVALARGMDVSNLNPEDWEAVSRAFGVSSMLVREIAWENDDQGYSETPAMRWKRIRAWVTKHLRA
jgi:hypothetical protein